MHHTSKLSNYDDLQSIGSFGFRGEALAAICASSSMSICSKTSAQDIGVQLQLAANGSIMTRQSIQRNQGTTIIVQDLFKMFPVRQMELKRNAKREFTKCVHMIQSYALIMDGVRFCVQHANGKKNETVFQCNGKCVKDNVISMFSYKQFASLIHVNDSSHDHIQYVLF